MPSKQNIKLTMETPAVISVKHMANRDMLYEYCSRQCECQRVKLVGSLSQSSSVVDCFPRSDLLML